VDTEVIVVFDFDLTPAEEASLDATMKPHMEKLDALQKRLQRERDEFFAAQGREKADAVRDYQAKLLEAMTAIVRGAATGGDLLRSEGHHWFQVTNFAGEVVARGEKTMLAWKAQAFGETTYVATRGDAEQFVNHQLMARGRPTLDLIPLTRGGLEGE
jgi:hypothetical protein